MTDNHAHRHSSHLFPFLYEIPAEIVARPDLLDAARATVRARLRWLESEQNDGEMAFGLAMLGWAAAHLGMAQEAERLVLRMARSFVLPSMVTTHNTHDLLNVDIGGGFPALIGQMLVQSSRGSVALLPALPRRWRAGRVTDLHCRGQVVVSDLQWTPDSLRVELTSPTTQRLSVRLPWPGRTAGHSEPATVVELELGPDTPALLCVQRAG